MLYSMLGSVNSFQIYRLFCYIYTIVGNVNHYVAGTENAFAVSIESNHCVHIRLALLDTRMLVCQFQTLILISIKLIMNSSINLIYTLLKCIHIAHISLVNHIIFYKGISQIKKMFWWKLMKMTGKENCLNINVFS